MNTRDDKAYATLTDVKNKTGDVFAMADEFGEVTITSYNKSKYVIKRLLITHSHIIRQTDEEAAQEDEIVEEEKIAQAVIEAAVKAELASLSAQTNPTTPEPEVTPEANEVAPEATIAPEPQPAVAEVVEITSAPEAALPEPEPTAIPQEIPPAIAAALPEVPAVVPMIPQAIVETPTIALDQIIADRPVIEPVRPEPEPVVTVVPPALSGPETHIENGHADKVPISVNTEIVGLLAGVSTDTLWNRDSKLEQSWTKLAHNLL